MAAFSFRRDFKKVQWGRTLGLNLLRAFSAGIVWGVIMLVMSAGSPASPDAPPWYAMPFILPFGLLFFIPIFIIASKIFVAVAGGLGEFVVFCFTVLAGLGIAIGDPLVFALHRTKPELVPTEKFNFLNFTLLLWVLDPQKVALAEATA